MRKCCISPSFITENTYPYPYLLSQMWRRHRAHQAKQWGWLPDFHLNWEMPTWLNPERTSQSSVETWDLRMPGPPNPQESLIPNDRNICTFLSNTVFKNKFIHSSLSLGILVLTFLIKDSNPITTNTYIHSNILYSSYYLLNTLLYTRNAKINRQGNIF